MTILAPPAPVPAPPNRANTAIRFFLGLAVVAFVAGVAVLVVSQDGEPYSPTDEPEAVVREYLNAFSRGDCERVGELSTEESLDYNEVDPSQSVDWCQALPGNGILSGNVEIENIETMAMSADYATVQFSLTIVGVPAEENRVQLAREAGEWKVDSTTLGFGGIGDLPGSIEGIEGIEEP